MADPAASPHHGDAPSGSLGLHLRQESAQRRVRTRVVDEIEFGFRQDKFGRGQIRLLQLGAVADPVKFLICNDFSFCMNLSCHFKVPGLHRFSWRDFLAGA